VHGAFSRRHGLGSGSVRGARRAVPSMRRPPSESAGQAVRACAAERTAEGRPDRTRSHRTAVTRLTKPAGRDSDIRYRGLGSAVGTLPGLGPFRNQRPESRTGPDESGIECLDPNLESTKQPALGSESSQGRMPSGPLVPYHDDVIGAPMIS